MRHGRAEEKGTKPDEERRLTKDGALAVQNVLEFAELLGMKPNLILTSPYERARETARLATEAFNAVVSREATLEPGHTPYELYGALSGSLLSKKNILLVFHQPMIGQVLSDLIGCEAANFSLSPGSIACVKIEGSPSKGSGTLLWLIPSSIERQK